MKLLTSLLLTFVLATSAFGLGNSGKSISASSPKFAMHDWIAFEGYKMADDEADLKWLSDNLDMYLYGTEAPDFGVLKTVINQLHPGMGLQGCHQVPLRFV